MLAFSGQNAKPQQAGFLTQRGIWLHTQGFPQQRVPEAKAARDTGTRRVTEHR